MAIMIPDSCPSKATVGEKRVFSLLQEGLPDSFTVWFEPVINGRYPDFTVLSDTFGLLVLEVKGWYAGQIARASDQDVEIHRNEEGQTHVETCKHPIRQVREYLFNLTDEMTRPEYAILRHPDGEHRGKLCFPYGYGVLLTNITRVQLAEAGIARVFPPEKVVCRDEIQELEKAGDREIIRRLRTLFPAPFPFDPLTEDQVKTIKGLLHKEVIVKRRTATAESASRGQGLLPGAVALDVLDAQQEQAARSLGAGHHVIFGIAGSGKTMILLARARLLAERDPDGKILVLCYNRALAAYLAGTFLNDPSTRNIEVRHFHSWAARKTGLRKRDDESFEAYQDRVVSALIEGAVHFAEAELYDAILIDEAHDFEPEWFRCATNLLRGGAEGDLLIALDGAQALYPRKRDFTWKSVGVRARGRTHRLSRNYRSTKPILEFAWQVSQAPVRQGEETETHVRVLPTKASRRGLPPLYRGCISVEEEHRVIARQVTDWLATGLCGREIAVLYPRKDRDRIDRLYEALRAVGEVCWLSNDGGGGTGIRLSTIHAAKGLEFPAVLVSALDQLPNPIDPDEIRDGNLLYVGLTRAIDRLSVTWVGRSRFTERVLQSGKAELLT